MKLVIYHGGCFDGFTAAWALARFCPEFEGAEFYGASYGEDPPPNIEGRDVVIVDFSYKRDVLLSMKEKCKSLRVYDHHKTAEEDLKGLDFCVFDMNRSGAGLAWDFFVDSLTESLHGDERHWLVDAVEDRDLWRFKLKGTREILACLAALPMAFEAWDDVGNSNVEDAIVQGRAIMRYIQTYGEKAMEHKQRIRIGGYDCWAINVAYQNCSDHIDTLLKSPGNDGQMFAASFFLNKRGLWQFSLRSRGEFDVSAVAKMYGGGGHKNAAGFEIKTLEGIL